MPLNGTAAGLYASIADWLNRSDLAAVIPDAVTLFEQSANNDPSFKSAFNRVEKTLATVASQNSVNLPADFREAETLLNLGNGGTQNIRTVKNYGNATALYTAFPGAAIDSGPPKGFIVLTSTLELAPVPDGVYTLTLYYYQKIAPLAANPNGNWLLANFPQVYLFGALLMMEPYLGSDLPNLSKWKQLYDTAVQALQVGTDRVKYSGSPIISRPDRIV